MTTQNPDLIKQLCTVDAFKTPSSAHQLMEEAAYALQALQAENERLVACLKVANSQAAWAKRKIGLTEGSYEA